MSTPSPLTTRDLRRIAEGLEREAKSLIKLADQLERRSNSAQINAERVEAMRAAGRRAIDESMRTIVQQTALPPETVDYWRKRVRKEEEAQARERRNRQIIRLAREGHTNKQLADLFQLSPRMISRVISSRPDADHPLRPR